MLSRRSRTGEGDRGLRGVDRKAIVRAGGQRLDRDEGAAAGLHEGKDQPANFSFRIAGRVILSRSSPCRKRLI